MSRAAPGHVLHSWLLFDESSGSLLTPSSLSHCQASLPAPTLHLPAKREPLVNASELEMSHSTLSRGWSVPRRCPLLGKLKNTATLSPLPLVDIQRRDHDCCSYQIEEKRASAHVEGGEVSGTGGIVWIPDPLPAAGFDVYFIKHRLLYEYIELWIPDWIKWW